MFCIKTGGLFKFSFALILFLERDTLVTFSGLSRCFSLVSRESKTASDNWYRELKGPLFRDKPDPVDGAEGADLREVEESLERDRFKVSAVTVGLRRYDLELPGSGLRLSASFLDVGISFRDIVAVLYDFLSLFGDLLDRFRPACENTVLLDKLEGVKVLELDLATVLDIRGM